MYNMNKIPIYDSMHKEIYVITYNRTKRPMYKKTYALPSLPSELQCLNPTHHEKGVYDNPDCVCVINRTF